MSGKIMSSKSFVRQAITATGIFGIVALILSYLPWIVVLIIGIIFCPIYVLLVHTWTHDTEDED